MLLDSKKLKMAPRELILSRANQLIIKHRQHLEPYTIHFMNMELLIIPNVFSPLYGPATQILGECLEFSTQDTVLEIGTGSGALACLALRQGVKYCIATDISPFAVECAQININRLSTTKSPKATIYRGDVFGPLDPEDKFSVIIFNPPFIDNKANDWLEMAFYDCDHATLYNFLENAKKHLDKNGKIVMIFGSAGNMKNLVQTADRYGYTIRLIKAVRNVIDFYVIELSLF